MTYVPHQRGKPNIVTQLEINKLLRPFHLKTYSVFKTAKITGCARKTIDDRFEIWDNEAILQLNLEFKKGDTTFQIEFLRANQFLIEDALDDLEAIKSDIDNARKNNSGTLPQLFAVKNKIRLSLQSLIEKRYAVKIEPGAARVIDRVFEDRLRKYVESTTQN